MKPCLLTLISCFFLLFTQAQTTPRIISEEAAKALQAVPYTPDYHSQKEAPLLTQAPIRPSTTPSGHVSSSAVTAVKVGSTTNFHQLENRQSPAITTYPSIGSNGGTVGLVFTPDQTCQPFLPRFWLRYALSTDGGQVWDIGQGAGNPPPASGCLGKGPLNTLDRGIFYAPNSALFLPPMASSVDSLCFMLSAAADYPNAQNYGIYSGVATHITDSVVITQEAYENKDFIDYYHLNSLTRQHNSVCGTDQFWFIGREYLTAPVYTDQLYRGQYDRDAKEISWLPVDTFSFPFFRQNSHQDSAVTNLQIAFSPDGETGWISFLGDLVGGQDSTYNPVFMRSNDGGTSWGEPEEVNLGKFAALRDSLLQAAMVMDANGQLRPVATGKATAAFQSDLVVDHMGNPHMFLAIGAASTIFDPLANYSVFPGLFLKLYDLTIDPYGEWNLIPIADLQSFQGIFGTDLPTFLFYSNTPMISRSASGSELFFNWIDTDTLQTGNTQHEAPNLYGRGLDLIAQQMTPIVNWTTGDTTFADRIYHYQTPEVVLNTGNQFNIPVVTATFDSTVWQTPTSLWYLQDITYDRVDFTDTVLYMDNCQKNPQVHGFQLTQPSCGGGMNGQVALQFQGGTAPYAVQWDNNAGSATTQTVAQLSAGTYGVVVTDKLGCEVELTALLPELGSPQVSIDPTTVIDVNCHGMANGSAQVSISGGLAPYTISWDNGEITSTANALDSGVHHVWVSDQNGCESFASVAISQPSPIRLATKIAHPLCAGDSNGYLSITPNGGSGGFQYAWSNGGTSFYADNLPSGTYSCQVTDKAGCSAMIQESLVAPAPLSVTASAKTPGNTCQSAHGVLQATAVGGSPPYAYDWVGAVGSGSLVLRVIGGTYGIRVVDDHGCAVTDTASSINPTHPTQGFITVTPQSECSSIGRAQATVTISKGNGPFTYKWDNGSTAPTTTITGNRDVVCTVQDIDGCESTISYASPLFWRRQTVQLFTLPNNALQFPYNGFVHINHQNLQAPITAQWSDGGLGMTRSDLAPGTYTITVTDACQSTINEEVIIIDKSFSQCNQVVNIQQKHACDQGNNGHLALQTSSGSFSYQWNTGDTTATISGLSAGSYSCIVTNLNSGRIDTLNAQVAASPPISATSSSTPDKGAFDGTATVSAAGGTAPYTYLWNSSPLQSGPTANNLPAGTYHVTITDALGCELVESVVVDANVSIDPKMGAINLTLSPNPTHEELTIQLDLPSTDLPTWTLWSMQGQRLMNGQLPRGRKWSQTIRLGELPEGLYLVEVETARGRVTRKVEVVR